MPDGGLSVHGKSGCWLQRPTPDRKYLSPSAPGGDHDPHRPQRLRQVHHPAQRHPPAGPHPGRGVPGRPPYGPHDGPGCRQAALRADDGPGPPGADDLPGRGRHRPLSLHRKAGPFDRGGLGEGGRGPGPGPRGGSGGPGFFPDQRRTAPAHPAGPGPVPGAGGPCAGRTHLLPGHPLQAGAALHPERHGAPP